ncbi:MAG: 16S rRNA (cytidine(1402)-2'-O)-methyltransferase [Pseudomonadota bacterium]
MSDRVPEGSVASDQREDLPSVSEQRLSQAVAAQLALQRAQPLPGGLYIVSTPIGHLSDITLRALDVLDRADVVLCEDTRMTRRLFARYSLRTHLLSYHEHNAERRRGPVLERLASGEVIALVSDAGTPLVADPGYKLVEAAIAAGQNVVAVPGASAAIAAVTMAGLPSDRFHFEGFLPSRAGARASRLAALAPLGATLVLYEAPGRVAATLDAMADAFGARAAAVLREMTKRHEEVVRGPLDQLAVAFAAREVRGECVIVVAGAVPSEARVDMSEVAERLAEARRTMRLKDAARAVADTFGLSRKEVYALGLRADAEGDARETGVHAENGGRVGAGEHNPADGFDREGSQT